MMAMQRAMKEMYRTARRFARRTAASVKIQVSTHYSCRSAFTLKSSHLPNLEICHTLNICTNGARRYCPFILTHNPAVGCVPGICAWHSHRNLKIKGRRGIKTGIGKVLCSDTIISHDRNCLLLRRAHSGAGEGLPGSVRVPAAAGGKAGARGGRHARHRPLGPHSPRALPLPHPQVSLSSAGRPDVHSK